MPKKKINDYDDGDATDRQKRKKNKIRQTNDLMEMKTV